MKEKLHGESEREDAGPGEHTRLNKTREKKVNGQQTKDTGKIMVLLFLQINVCTAISASFALTHRNNYGVCFRDQRLEKAGIFCNGKPFQIPLNSKHASLSVCASRVHVYAHTGTTSNPA